MSTEVLTVATTQGELRYTRDDDGFIRMENPQTTRLYHELRYEKQPDLPAMGIFCAFSNSQFEEGVASLKKRGFIKDTSELKKGPVGCFGTSASFAKLYKAYDEIWEEIRTRCDPQEVYFYEFNNHETPYSWEGDMETMRLIVDIWGYDIAISLRRYCRTNDAEISKLNN